MAYEKGKNAKVLNYIKDQLKAGIPAAGGRVYLSYPALEMPSGSMPQIFIGRQTGETIGGTNRENRDNMRLNVIAYISKNQGMPIEIAKAHIQEDIAAVLLALKMDDGFRAFATDINIRGYDCGPAALAPLGYGPGVFPPYGAIRIDVEIEFFYRIV